MTNRLSGPALLFSLALLLIGMASGIGLGYLSWHQEAPIPPTRVEIEKLDPAAPSLAELAKPLSSSDSFATERESRPAQEHASNRTSPQATEADSLDAGFLSGLQLDLDALRSLKRPTGSGMIAGKVIDSVTGAPLEGALIEVYPFNPPIPYTRSPEKSPRGYQSALMFWEEEARRNVLRAATVLQGRYSAVSMADGTFEVRGLPDGEFAINCCLADYVMTGSEDSQWNFPASRARPGQSWTFRGEVQYAFHLNVVMPDRSQASPIPILWAALPKGTDVDDPEAIRQFRETWDPEKINWLVPGTPMWLAPGHYLFLPMPKAVHGMVSADPVIVHSTREATRDVQFFLRQSGGIQAIVRDPSSSFAGAQLSVHCVPSQDLVAPETLDDEALAKNSSPEERRLPWFVDTAAGTSPMFKDLEPGRYLIAALSNSRVVAHCFAEYQTGVLSVDLVLGPMGADQRTIVRVNGPKGALLHGLKVSAKLLRPDGVPSGEVLQVRPSQDGGFMIMHPLSSIAGTQVAIAITVATDELGSITTRHIVGTSEEVIIQLSAAGWLNIVVDPVFGQEAALKNISLAVEDPYLGWELKSRKTADAGFRIGPFQPGSKVEVVTYLKISNIPSLSMEDHAISVQWFDTVAGESHLRIVMPTLYPLSVSVPSLSPGEPIRFIAPHPPQLAEGRKRPRAHGGLNLGVDRTKTLPFMPPGGYFLLSDEREDLRLLYQLPSDSPAVLGPR